MPEKDKSWAEQAEALLKRRRALLREFSKLEGEARRIAEANLEQSMQAEMHALVRSHCHRFAQFVSSTPAYYNVSAS